MCAPLRNRMNRVRVAPLTRGVHVARPRATAKWKTSARKTTTSRTASRKTSTSGASTPRRSTAAAATRRKRGVAGPTRARRSSAATTEFKCPECGRTFLRAAALGAHRSRAHGVAGKTALATAAKRRASGSARRTRAAANGDGLQRDAMIAAVFPNGIPPREEVIRSVNAWLDEAERLSRLS